MARSTKRYGGPGVIRVVATEAIITDDNDLIVRGTTGTLISWAPPDWIPGPGRGKRGDERNIDPVRKPEHRYVIVAWDAHMFGDVPVKLIAGAKDETIEGASTVVGHEWLLATVHIDQISLHSKGNH